MIPATRKPKVTNAGSSLASTSTTAIKAAAAIDDDGMPSVSSVPAFGSGALPPVKKKKVAGSNFSSEMQKMFDMLKREVAKGALHLFHSVSIECY